MFVQLHDQVAYSVVVVERRFSFHPWRWVRVSRPVNHERDKNQDNQSGVRIGAASSPGPSGSTRKVVVIISECIEGESRQTEKDDPALESANSPQIQSEWRVRW